jgi:hypothetical protein
MALHHTLSRSMAGFFIAVEGGSIAKRQLSDLKKSASDSDWMLDDYDDFPSTPHLKKKIYYSD